MDEMIMPNHVAIIMDGNRRWAKERGLSSLQGHKKGAQTLREINTYIYQKGVNYLSVYAFSTENFNRSPKEVNYLMDLFVNEFKKEYKDLDKKGVRVIFSGSRELLRDDVIAAMNEITEKTKGNNKGVLNVCLGYGGREEIINATKMVYKDALEGKLDVDSLDEVVFSKYLYQDLPPIDLMIRTSGEQRISNFMLWQASYAEFYFPTVHFPDFNENEFDKAIGEFNKRNRRFGGDKNENKSN